MAAPSTTRRNILSAMVMAPVAIAGPAIAGTVAQATEWQTRLAEFEARDALYEAEYAFGSFKIETDKGDWETMRVESLYGGKSAAVGHPEGADLLKALRKQDNKICEVACDRYSTPRDQAAFALINTPAPDLLAVRKKIQVIKDLDLYSLGDDPSHLMAIIEADVKRLTGIAA